MAPRISPLRQRMPCVGLFAAASAGILVAYAFDVGSLTFVFATFAFVVWWILRRKSLPIYLAFAAAFAAIFLWQTTESPSYRLAASIPAEGSLHTLQGRVMAEPQPYGQGRVHFPLRVEMPRVLFAAMPQVLVIAEGSKPQRGDVVQVTGKLARLAPPRNPGAFDARRWMAQQGIYASLEVTTPLDFVTLRSPSEPNLASIARGCRDWMLETLRIGIADDTVVSDLIAGMILGVTAAIPDSLQNEFRSTGTFHLFSVSGLHVGMIGVLLWQALKLFGIRRRAAVFIIIPALFFYVLITGWKPASLRAAIMAAIFLIGLSAARQPLALNSLCAAGLVILAGWTSELFSAGFQFSFLVVAAILLLSEPVHSAIRRVVHPDPFLPRQLYTGFQKWAAGFSEHFGGLCAVSLAAWVGSLPLTVCYFHLVSLSALPANLAIIPIAFLIMATGVLALVGGLLTPWLAAVFNNANWVFTKSMLLVVQTSAALPGSHFFVGLPPAAPVVLTVFDFSPGAATAIESGGKIWLIDSGPAFALDGVLMPWLQSRGRQAPDALVLTHGDARHIGSAETLSRLQPTPRIIETTVDDRSPVRGKLHRALAAAGIPKSLYEAGDNIPMTPGVTIETLYPPAGIARDLADDKALVVRVKLPHASVLMLSDAGAWTQDWVTTNARDKLAADILILGRHRSGFLPEASFLDVVNPSLIIATTADFPESEKMSASWQALVTQRGIRIFRQDYTGAVSVLAKERSLSARGFLNGETFNLPIPRN